MTAARTFGRGFENAFLVAPPLLALGVAFVLRRTGISDRVLADGDTRIVDLGIGVLIHAHLVAVVFRSHLDRGIFVRHPIRFVVVPVALFAALVVSEWVTAAAIVVATFWDVYHSGAQTFGLARILDRNDGRVATERSRLWDALVSQVSYAGPIAAGVSLDAHVESFESFADLDGPVAALLASAPASVVSARHPLALAVLGLGAAVLVGFVAHRVALARRGEGPGARSTLLLASTAFVSLVSWGFDPWGEAFFVMNAFHAVQYLALVWATQSGRFRARFAVPTALGPTLFLGAVYLGTTLAYGTFVELLDPDRHALWSLTMVVSLMHFWYDGFVWSVSRGDV